jgi:hypothetical protein
VGVNTENGFIEYRHLHCKHLCPDFPAVTFKFDVNQDEEIIKFSFSVCSSKDNFSRRVGREIADKRMEDGAVVSSSYDRKSSLTENAMDIMNSIINRYEEGTDGLRDEIDADPVHKKFYQDMVRARDALYDVRVYIEDEEMFSDEIGM